MLSNQQKIGYVVVILIVIAILGGLTWMTLQNNASTNDQGESDLIEQQDTQDSSDTSMIKDEMQNELVNALMGLDYAMEGELEDVTDGEVRGINTQGRAAGIAKANYDEKTGYRLFAEFDELPDPVGDDFYEGWVVRSEPFAFISTGALVLENGNYVNAFESNEDYSAYSKYVLTLEPNDGDPAPDAHIVEGEMKEVIGVK